MKEKLRNMFLRFYIKFIERYKDGTVPRGHLFLFVFNDDYEVRKRSEDGRFFILSKKDNENSYREVIIIDEYPEFNIYDVTFEDIDKYCSSEIKGKVEGEDRFIYFAYKNN